MQIGSWDHGNLHLVPIYRTLDADTNMQFDLGKLPSTINGQPAAVVTLLLGSPTLQWSVPQNKYGDGLSAAQVLGQSLRLSMSPECPYNAFDGGDILIAGVDAPRAMEALARTSGLPVIYGADTLNAAAPGGAGATTAYSLANDIAAQLMGSDLAGPLRKVFPIGQGTGAGAATFSDVIWYAFPVGVQARARGWEDITDTAIPCTMFNGQGYDASGQRVDGSSGQLLFSVNGTTDGNAITVVGTTWSLYALCLTHSPSKQPSPTPVMIRKLGGSGSTSWNARAGIREYLALQKPLVPASGVQPTHAYVNVACYVDGKLMNEPVVAINRIGQSYMYKRDTWRPTFAENALPNRSATRLSRWGVDLLFRDDSILQAPGSVNHLTMIDITDPGGETDHQIIDVTRTPVTDKVEARAVAWNGRPGAVRKAGTRNGNDLRPDVEAIFKPLLPGKILSPVNGVMPAMSGPANIADTVNPNSGSQSAAAKPVK